MNKKVYCYSPEGEFIAEYESARTLDKKFNLYPDSFRKHIGTNKVYKECLWSYEKKDDFFDFTKKKPKILIFDIETAPLKGYFWRVWKENIPGKMLIDDWFMLTWAAKWAEETEMFSDKLSPKEAVDKDDSRIVTSLWYMIDEADVIIAHNAGRFDIPKMNTRFLKHGMNPPSPYRMIDTLLVSKRKFGQTYNSLNELAKFLGFDPKMTTDFSLWERCLNGEQEALDYMALYDEKDVKILEEVYLALRKWMDSHPNVSLYYNDDKERCHRCGSEKIQWTKDFYYTPMGKYSVYRCPDCGGVGRARNTAISKSKRESLNSPVAR